MLDSGNALFEAAGHSDAGTRARARFILSTMGRLGTRAMAVGVRDLSGGAAFLGEAAKASGVEVLSANLTRGRKAVFPASTVVSAEGVKVAVVGVTVPGDVVGEPELKAGPTLPAVRAALRKLGPRDVTVVLAATSYVDAQQLARALGAEVDFVIQSGEYRGSQPPQRVGEATGWVLASGQKGQAAAKLELSLGEGRGPWLDLGAVDRERLQLQALERQVATFDERVAVARDAAGRKALEEARAPLAARRDALKKSIALASGPGARTLRQSWVVLGRDVTADAALEAEVKRAEPTWTATTP